VELRRELGEDRELAARRAHLLLDGLDRAPRLDHRAELIRDVWVVPRPGKTSQLRPRGVRAQRDAVGAVDEHGVVVDDRAERPGGARDLVADDLVRIAGAIPTLAAGADDRDDAP